MIAPRFKPLSLEDVAGWLAANGKTLSDRPDYARMARNLRCDRKRLSIMVQSLRRRVTPNPISTPRILNDAALAVALAEERARRRQDVARPTRFAGRPEAIDPVAEIRAWVREHRRIRRRQRRWHRQIVQNARGGDRGDGDGRSDVRGVADAQAGV